MHLNMSYSEVHRLPIRYRRWFLRRLTRHFDEKNKLHEDLQSNSTNKNNDLDDFNKFQSQIDKKFL